MKLNLVRKIKVNKKYRIEDEGEPISNADDWARAKVVYDGAIYPKQHAGHIVKVMKYYPPTGASCTGDVEVECMTCEKILDFLISDQFLEELKEPD